MKKWIVLIALLSVAGYSAANLVNDGTFTNQTGIITKKLYVGSHTLGAPADGKWTANLSNVWVTAESAQRIGGNQFDAPVLFTGSSNHVLAAGSYSGSFDATHNFGYSGGYIAVNVFVVKPTAATWYFQPTAATNGAPTTLGCTFTRVAYQMWGDTTPDWNNTRVTFNMTNDTAIAANDVVVFQIRSGYSYATTPPASYFTVDNVVIPEPATVGMLGLGALVALLVRRIRA